MASCQSLQTMAHFIIYIMHRKWRDWIAEQNALHHGGRWTDLGQAIDYALFRGSGEICAVKLGIRNRQADL